MNSEIGDGTVIGCGVIIGPNSKIGQRCLIASGTVVPSGTILESEGVYVGSPARFIRKILDSDLEVYDEMFIEQEKVTKIIQADIPKDYKQIKREIEGSIQRFHGEDYYYDNLPGETFDRFIDRTHQDECNNMIFKD